MNKFVNSFEFNSNSYNYCDLKKIFEASPKLRNLPYTLKILLEQNIRNTDENKIDDVLNIFANRSSLSQIKFICNRIVLNELNSVPLLVDFDSINDYFNIKNLSSKLIQPKVMIDVIVDNLDEDIDKNEKKNKERYTFLKYVANKYKNISIIPPNINNTQINLEYLSTMISLSSINNKVFLFPEVLCGTDEHSTVINSLGVLGLNVGRLQLQSTIFDSYVTFDFPNVIGIEIKGSLSQGLSFKDVIQNLKTILINKNINGKIVEFYGDGLKNISIEDRVLFSNLVIECKGLCGYFPIDNNTISYIEKTRGVDASLIKMYYEKQDLYQGFSNIKYDESIKLDLSTLKPITILLKTIEEEIFIKDLSAKLKTFKKGKFVQDNQIVLSLIDMSTEKSISLLIQACLIAKKASDFGIFINKDISKFIVFDSLVQKQYLEKLDLLKYLEKLNFKIIDKDEITISESIALDIEKFNLNVVCVSNSKRIKDNKLSNLIKLNWMMSPALVIAYSLKGNTNFEITKESLVQDIYLSDIWPSMHEVNEYIEKLDFSIYKELYTDVLTGDEKWKDIKTSESLNYDYEKNATYVNKIDSFNIKNKESINISNAKILALLDDNINTEDLSPLGNISSYSPCALYLKSLGLRPDEFNTYENRHANAYVMIRSILSNLKLKNRIVYPKVGGYTKDFISGEIMTMYDFSLKMKENQTPLVVIAGNRFGLGKINDWSVKGLKLLGVKIVIAKSFSNRYKNNLVKVGILPLEFIEDDIDSLKLEGNELLSIDINRIKANDKIDIKIVKNDEVRVITFQSKLENSLEVEYYKKGGAVEYLLKDNLK
ncbi:aconitase family protein [Arcobacter peruensis]|uniref:aconitase family protein n=1 Tax=Arcobacter peruensis TaxID=2320140 RepID=UPI000F08CB71|nr:aconitase family protein [Arcobacter peruensis]